MKFKSGFFRRAETSSLKTKLLCIYFLLVVLPLGFFTVYACLRVRGVMQKQTLTAAQNAFDDTFLSLQQTFRKLDEVLDILVMDPIVYDMASNAPEDYTYISRLEDSDQLALTFAYLCNLSGLRSEQHRPAPGSLRQQLVHRPFRPKRKNLVCPARFRGPTGGREGVVFLHAGHL